MRAYRLSVRRLVVGVLLLGLSLPAAAQAAQPATLVERIHNLAANPGLGQMRVGVKVVLLGRRPEVLFLLHSEEAFKPASNQKLLTTAAALALLPADFTYRTILAIRGQDLVVIGSGDPSIGDPKLAQAQGEPITMVFRRLADKLKAAGITRIKGDLLFDDFIFEQQHLHPHWPDQFKGQMLSWWAAPVGGLNFNDNCVDIVVKPGLSSGSPAEVTLIPKTPWVNLHNTAKTAAKGEPVVSRSGNGPLTISVSGPVSKANDPKDPLSIPIIDPGAFFASALHTTLAAQGVTIEGDNRRERIRQRDNSIPKDLKIIAVHEQRLKDILWRVNKSSQNLFAEAMLKTVAAYAGGGEAPRVGGYDTGGEVLSLFIQQVGASPQACVIDDGSGLSHSNRLTPAVLTAILVRMDRHARRDEFRDSLAVPGEKEGTLRKRMKDLADKVCAKTGHIEGVSTLSGYVDGPNDRHYAFSIMCNDTHRAKSISAHQLQDTICRDLATWAGPIGEKER